MTDDNGKQTDTVPVIAIDGPSGSGKGTISQAVAERLGFNYLDSGAIYRSLGYLAHSRGVPFDDQDRLVEMASTLALEFRDGSVFLEGENIDAFIRTEEGGKRASLVSPIPAVRETLLKWQRGCARSPGLVADGRDMGSVVFPGARLKIFLTASAEARAERRFKQLRDKGFDVNIRQLFEEISQRDERDASRKVSPLKPADDAISIDTTEMSIDGVINLVMQLVNERLG